MSVEEIKRVARRYHDLNPEDVESILTADFVGRHQGNTFPWYRDGHKSFLGNHPEMKDTIHEQIAERDWVATRFTRTMTWQGRPVEVENMHFKRFEDGKIAEIWEYFDFKQLDP